MLEFEWPWVFALLPIPFVMYFILPPARVDTSALRVPFFNALENINTTGMGSGNSHIFLKILALLMWSLLVTATARPQWLGEPVPIAAEGRDLLLAVDISGSMEEADMELNGRLIQRIDLVKYVVGDFVNERKTDRLGLVLFGTQAFLQVPLTFDRTTVGKLLQEAQLGFAGEKTAIGDAIGLSIKRLKERPENSRVLILLTDGANSAGEVDPRQAADLAKVAGIKIYTISIASDRVVRRGFGFMGVTRADADLDEATLEYIAQTTGGRYFRARDTKELQNIYKELNLLEPVEQNDEIFRPTNALYYWPLSAALLVSILLALLNSVSLFSKSPRLHESPQAPIAKTHKGNA